MTNTESILEHHLTAFVQQDLSEIMKDYSDESIIVTNIGTFQGCNGIEHLFDDLFSDLSQDRATVEITQKTVKDDFAYVIWRAETPANVYEFATDTFYIPEDEISFQTFAAKISSKDRS